MKALPEISSSTNATHKKRIKAELTDSLFYVAADETTDVEGRYALNIVVGKLSIDQYYSLFLLIPFP